MTDSLTFINQMLTFANNVTTNDRQIVASVFNITQQNSLGKYLGYPPFKGRPR